MQSSQANYPAPTNLPSIRWLILADTLLVAGFFLLLLILASPLANATDLPVNFLRGAGAILAPWAGFLGITWKRSHIPKAAVTTTILVNMVWVASSLGIVVADVVEPNALGVAFILVQSGGVLLLALLQHTRWRTMT